MYTAAPILPAAPNLSQLSGPVVPLIRSFEGIAGAKFTAEQLIVTTPNMPVVHAPTMICYTRMRRALNFGKDDPSYWPQVFNSIIGHITVIPSPDISSSNPLRHAWYQPSDEDFVLDAGGVVGVGSLSSIVRVQLSKLSLQLQTTVESLPPSHCSDPILSLV